MRERVWARVGIKNREEDRKVTERERGRWKIYREREREKEIDR